MTEFKCGICHEKHSILGDIIFPEPALIFNMSEKEKEERIDNEGSLFIIDKELIFVNGCINLEWTAESKWFSWQVWAKIEMEEFLQKFTDLKSNEKITPLKAVLENEILFYPNAQNLKVVIELSAHIEDTVIEVVEENHALTNDQKNGITTERLIELMQMIYHLPESQLEEGKDSSVDELVEALEKAEIQYLNSEKKFGINVLSNSAVVFQLVCSSLLEKEGGEAGFGIHLPFDQSFLKGKENYVKFKTSKYYQKFDANLWDGIPTYQLNLGKDKEKIENFVNGLLKEVYEIKDPIRFELFEF